MQNVQGLQSSNIAVRVNAADKIAESPPPLGVDIVKKLQHHAGTISQTPQETTECSRMPRVTSSRDQMTLNSNQGEKHFQATIVADKYLLLDQVEGSSLYRCMDVNTQEELVCKVSDLILIGIRPYGIHPTKFVMITSELFQGGLHHICKHDFSCLHKCIVHTVFQKQLCAR